MKDIKFTKNAITFTEPLLNKYPIHEILWVDASGKSGWMPIHDELEPMYCITAGYVIGEDRYRLIMAGSLNAGADKGDVIYIPKGCILKKRKICPRRKNVASKKSNTLDKEKK